MSIGILKWYNETKGFGLIGTPDKGEFFIHYSNLKKGVKNLETGIVLSFESRLEKNRQSAIKCKPIEGFEDFILILKYLGKKDIVVVEIETSGISYHGNLYTSKEETKISLIKNAFQQLEKAKIIEYLKRYYDEILDADEFIAFCNFIENLFPTKDENISDQAKLIFSYFGENLDEDTLFVVWEERAFQFIGKDNSADYEISLSILLKKKQL